MRTRKPRSSRKARSGRRRHARRNSPAGQKPVLALRAPTVGQKRDGAPAFTLQQALKPLQSKYPKTLYLNERGESRSGILVIREGANTPALISWDGEFTPMVVTIEINNITNKQRAKKAAGEFALYPVEAWTVDDQSTLSRGALQKMDLFIEALSETPAPKAEEMVGALSEEQLRQREALAARKKEREARARASRKGAAAVTGQRRDYGVSRLTTDLSIGVCDIKKLPPAAVVVPVSEQLLYMMRSMYIGDPCGKTSEDRAASVKRRSDQMGKQFLPEGDVPALLGLSTVDIRKVLTAAESTSNQSIKPKFFESLEVSGRRSPDFVRRVLSAARVPEKLRNVPVFLVPFGTPTSPLLMWAPNRKKVFTEKFLSWVWSKSNSASGRQYGVVFMPPVDGGDRGSDKLSRYLRSQMQAYFTQGSEQIITRAADLKKTRVFTENFTGGQLQQLVVNCTLRIPPAQHYLDSSIYPPALFESDFYTPGPYLDRLILNVLTEAVCLRAANLGPGRELMERADLDRAVRKLKSEYCLNDIDSLVDFIEAVDGLSDEMKDELMGMVQTFTEAVNYASLEAANKDKRAKKALRAYLYREIPARPKGCVRTDITPDAASVDAYVFTIYPSVKSEGAPVSMEIRTFQTSQAMEMEDVVFIGSFMDYGASQRTKMSAQTIEDMFGESQAMAYLAQQAKEGELAPLTYAFVTAKGGRSNWPRDLQRPVERKKGFYLAEMDHLNKEESTKTFLLKIGRGSSGGAPAISVSHTDARRLYNFLKQRTRGVVPEDILVETGEGVISVPLRAATLFSGDGRVTAARVRDRVMLLGSKYKKEDTGSRGGLVQKEADLDELLAKLKALQASPAKGSAARKAQMEKEAERLSKSLSGTQARYQALEGMNIKHPFLYMWELSLFQPPGIVRGGGPTARLAAQAGVTTRGRQFGVKTDVSQRTVFVDKPGFRGPPITKLTRFLKDMGQNADFPLRSSQTRPTQMVYDIPDVGGKDYEKTLENYIGLRRLRRKILDDSELKSYDLPTMRHPPLGETEAEQLISKLNPRNAMSRKTRKSRRRRARRNPTDAYRSAISENLVGEKPLPENWNVQLPEDSFTYQYTPNVFLRKGENLTDLQAQSIAERLGEQPYVRHLQRPPADDFDSFEPEDIESLAGQAGLSLVEARNLARRYIEAGKRRKNTTIPASSALCGANRRPKLKGYRPPATVMDFPGVGARRKVFIWISPVGLDHVRVMTFRRNTHIDCDFVSSVSRGQSYGQLLALSMQDTLMWLAQKESRRTNTSCYVGRVGDSNMFLFWSPGQDLSYDTALDRMKTGKAPIVGYDRQADIDAYMRAIGLQPPEFNDDTPSTPQPAAGDTTKGTAADESGTPVDLGDKEEEDSPF